MLRTEAKKLLAEYKDRRECYIRGLDRIEERIEWMDAEITLLEMFTDGRTQELLKVGDIVVAGEIKPWVGKIVKVVSECSLLMAPVDGVGHTLFVNPSSTLVRILQEVADDTE